MMVRKWKTNAEHKPPRFGHDLGEQLERSLGNESRMERVLAAIARDAQLRQAQHIHPFATSTSYRGEDTLQIAVPIKGRLVEHASSNANAFHCAASSRADRACSMSCAR